MKGKFDCKIKIRCDTDDDFWYIKSQYSDWTFSYVNDEVFIAELEAKSCNVFDILHRFSEGFLSSIRSSKYNTLRNVIVGFEKIFEGPASLKSQLEEDKPEIVYEFELGNYDFYVSFKIEPCEKIEKLQFDIAKYRREQQENFNKYDVLIEDCQKEINKLRLEEKEKSC